MPDGVRELRGRRPEVCRAWREFGVGVEFYPRYVKQQARPHTPGMVLLSYLVRGRARHILGDEVHEDAAGSLSVIHYGEVHDIVTGPEGVDVMNVYLDPERHPLPPVPAELRGVLPELIPLHPALRHNLNRMVRLQFAEPEAVSGHLFAMERELREAQPGHFEALLLHLRLLLIACCRAALASGWSLPSMAARPADDAAERVRRQIDAEYARPHTLAELAGGAGCAPAVLCRRFKAHTGKTVFQYLLHRRIQAAMLQLRGTDDKVFAIARDCGFSDLSHFNRKFREVVGKSPGAYRRTTPAGV